MNQARVAVAGIAADTLRSQRVSLVTFKTKRDGKGMDAELTHVVFDGLHARLVAKRGVRVLGGVKGLRGVKGRPVPTGNGWRRAQVAVDMKQFLGEAIKRLQIGVGDGPRGRDASPVLNHPKVLSPHAEHRSPVDLGLATHKVRLLRA